MDAPTPTTSPAGGSRLSASDGAAEGSAEVVLGEGLARPQPSLASSDESLHLRSGHHQLCSDFMATAPNADTPTPQQLLLAAYTQWIDLARNRSNQHSEIDHTVQVRKYLWYDDDNSSSDVPEVVTSPLLSESLLCFLLPTLDLEAYSLFKTAPTKNHQKSATDARKALRHLKLNRSGDPSRVQSYDKPVDLEHIRVVLEVIREYYNLLTKSTDDPDQMAFSAGTYISLEEADALASPAVPVVDAYSLGLSVALRVLNLLNQLEEPAKDAEHIEGAEEFKVLREEIKNFATKQLGKSLQGLNDCFVVKQMSASDWDDTTERQFLWDSLERDTELPVIRKKLATLGYRTVIDSAFECGWTWGPSKPAAYSVHAIPALLPEPAPYLYFTSVALAAIDDLQDNSLQAEALMEDHHFRLASELRTLAELTTRYWTILARQEDDQGYPRALSVPWVTTDEDGSAYYTLYLLGIVFGTAAADLDIESAIDILEELAQRGRITTRHLIENRRVVVDEPVENDRESGSGTERAPTRKTVREQKPEPIVEELHQPGKMLPLEAPSTSGKRKDDKPLAGHWRIYDYSPLLLKVACQVLYRTRSHETRERVSRLVAAILRHLDTRKLPPIKLEEMVDGLHNPDQHIPGVDWGMWDDFGSFARARDVKKNTRTWYFTQRTVEALTLSIKLHPPFLDSPNMKTLLKEILTELEGEGADVQAVRILARQSSLRALATALKMEEAGDSI